MILICQPAIFDAYVLQREGLVPPLSDTPFDIHSSQVR